MGTARQDLFTVIHKAIRALLYDLGAELQRTEFADAEASHAVLERLDTTLAMIGEHARHENQFIFSELRHAVPRLVDDLEAEHVAVEAQAEAIARKVAALHQTCEPEARTQAGQELNHGFNEFVAAYLAHMNREEREALPATWAHFDDGQIGAMRTRIQRDTDPGRYREWLRWMFASQTESELVTLFSGVKSSAPPDILAQMTGVASQTLGDSRWGSVRTRAGL